MLNLFNQYFSEIPMEYWEKLFDALQFYETTLRGNIMNENGQKKMKNAENALNSLLSALENYIWPNMHKAA